MENVRYTDITTRNVGNAIVLQLEYVGNILISTSGTPANWCWSV